MPVSLFTGLPGSGKTASLVAEIVRLTKAEPGRPIFQMGINGLKPGIAAELTMEQLLSWWELPPGSIICLDECQEDHLMPKDRGNPSQWVQRITKVRHYGMQFLLTTQHPANMSAYVRRLVDLHVHSVMRSKGVRQTFTWMRCIDDPDSRREKKFAESSFKPLPKEVFDLYTSSSLHTMKVRVPRIVYLAAAMAVAAVALAIYIPHRFNQLRHPDAVSFASGAVSSSKSDGLRQADFAKWMKPRVAAVPWSAPMFDHLEVKAEPRLYCISSNDDGRCLCDTEQGTRYDVPLKQCRLIVQNGLYNPFAAPVQSDDSQRDGSRDSSADGGQKAASLPDSRSKPATSDGLVSSADAWKSSSMRADYQPPEAMKSMDPIPHTF